MGKLELLSNQQILDFIQQKKSPLVITPEELELKRIKFIDERLEYLQNEKLELKRKLNLIENAIDHYSEL